MDPEPDRCRRTDGKKWRCRKTAVPNQKYCDRHMHRGRQGTRKQAECNNKMPSSSEYRGGIIPVSAQNNLSRSHLDIKPDIHQLNEDPRMQVERNNQRISTDIKKPNSSLVASEKYRGGVIPVSAQNNLGQSHLDRKRGNHQVKEEGKECSFENASPKLIDQHTTEKVKQPRFISPGFGSPKSVLYGGAGKVELSLGPKNITERIPPRCRRTDGKKWQCSRDALPSQKYCQSHMHRGAKRATQNPQYAITFPRPSGNSINLNAIPKSPQHVGDNNSTSSGSDATTITDENITLSLAQSLNS